MNEQRTRRTQRTTRQALVLLAVAALLFIAGASEAEEPGWRVMGMACMSGVRPVANPAVCPFGLTEKGGKQYPTRAACETALVAVEAHWDAMLAARGMVSYPVCMPKEGVDQVIEGKRDYTSA